MQLRRPIATLLTALALFGGGATMTACQASGQDANDGTTDGTEPPTTETNEESDPSQDNVPNLSDPEQDGGTGSEDVEDG